MTLINYKIADALYIDWRSGIKTAVVGIDGRTLPAYLHDLEFEIDQFQNGKIRSRIAFGDLKGIGVLLGQYGFFEHFRVTFDLKHEQFEVDLPA